MREPIHYEAPACAEVGGDFWFPEKGGSQDNTLYARTICSTCIHKIECGQWGVYNERHGVWGGLTEKERRIARRRLGIVLREDSQ